MSVSRAEGQDVSPVALPEGAPQRTPAYAAVARVGSLAQRVISQIEEMIADSRLSPGDRLPSERELGRQFGVSRTVVREAVHALTARGMLSTEQGIGTVVCGPSALAVAESLSRLIRADEGNVEHTHLIEVRRLLEVEIAGLAAARRTQRDLLVLNANLAAAPPNDADCEAFAHNDVAFHYALAAATQNALFPLFLDSIAPVLFAARVLGYAVPGTPARAQFHHRRILDGVAAQDVEEARAAMQAHMVEAEETMRAAVVSFDSQRKP